MVSIPKFHLWPKMVLKFLIVAVIRKREVKEYPSILADFSEDIISLLSSDHLVSHVALPTYKGNSEI